jgi:hypothetical protein
MPLSRKYVARLAALGVAAAAAIALPATAAHATGPTIDVTPSTLLQNGQTVSVSGSGFTPSSTFYISECGGVDNPAAQCDTSHIVTGQTDPDGLIPATDYVVHTGAIGSAGDTCPSSTAAGGNGCFIAATTSLTDATQGTAKPINFAPVVGVVPATNVKNNATVKVSGYGFPDTKATVYVVECGGTGGQADCDIGTLKTGKTNAAGEFSNVALTVHTGTVGDKTCNPGGPCFAAAATSASPTAAQEGAGVFTFAASTKPIATSTSAKYHKQHHKITGKVTAGGKGVAGGFEVDIQKKKHGNWKTVAEKTTFTGGTFKAKVHKSGRYRAATPKQGNYLASHSKVLHVKV